MADRSPAPGAGATLESFGIPQIGDLIADKYRVENLVGRGGMGVVLAARHVHLQQSVAIKVLDLSLDDDRREEWIARFFHEGRIAAGLPSEHIARVYDLGLLQDRGIPYMVMELLEGADLAALLARQKQLSVEHAVECVRQAGSAIALAHRQGIVHRDLKPSNLFVTKRADGSGLIKVLDFGISKSLDDPAEDGSLTTSRAVLGSPFYMSPEQLRDAKRVDHRTDIWSLGAILHELLSGSPPFEADTFPAACAAIAADAPPSILRLRDDVPEALERVVMRCLEKNPADRYNFAGDLVVALQPFSAAARGRPAPRFDTSRSLLEASAEDAAGPGATPASTADPHSATLKAADHEHAARPLETAASALEVVAPTSTAPAESTDAVSVTLTSEQPTSGTNTGSAEPVEPLDQKVPSTPGGAARAGHRWVAAGSVAVVLVAGALWIARSKAKPASAPKPAPSALLVAATAASSFSLLIESSPSGAEVYENNERLGTTPLALKIDRESVARRSRVFELRREGYETHYFEQGMAEGDTTHTARLTKLPAPPAASARVPSSPQAKKTPRKKATRGSPPVEPEASDIRMSR